MTTQPQVLQASSELSDEQLISISETALVIGCKCPAYLVKLLREVKEFRRYTSECKKKFPQDTATHEWLCFKASEVEQLLSQTIFEFLQKENLLDAENQISQNRLYERAHEIALSEMPSLC